MNREDAPDMSTTIYTVTGMTCQHCVNAVTEEVSALPGVDVAQVDLASGQLTVAGAVTTEQVRAAVEEAGYELASASGSA